MQSVSRAPRIFAMSLRVFCRDTSRDFGLASDCVCSYGEATRQSRSDLDAAMLGRPHAAPGAPRQLIYFDAAAEQGIVNDARSRRLMCRVGRDANAG
jgi:hypothetical protein